MSLTDERLEIMWRDMTATNIERPLCSGEIQHKPYGSLDRTPLHLAVCFTKKSELYEVVRIITDTGANINAEDKEGRTALTYAKEKNCDQYVIQLLERLTHRAKSRDSLV